MIPVGKTNIFSRMEYHTLKNPKNTPNSSRTTRWVGISRYCSKIQSKMGLIPTSVGFYDFHIQQTLVHKLKSGLYFRSQHLHNLIILPIDLGTQRIFQNGESGSP